MTKLKEYILEERKFLHDISNHIVIVEGMLSSGLRKLEFTDDQKSEIEKFNKSLNAAAKIRELMISRKAQIEKIQETIAD